MMGILAVNNVIIKSDKARVMFTDTGREEI